MHAYPGPCLPQISKHIHSWSPALTARQPCLASPLSVHRLRVARVVGRNMRLRAMDSQYLHAMRDPSLPDSRPVAVFLRLALVWLTAPIPAN